MKNTDWYNNRTWNTSIEKEFFDKLSRARSNKYQYLYIQAAKLADKYPSKSLALFEYYFDGRTDYYFDAAAFAYKAKAHISLNQVDKAIAAFEASLSSLATHGGIDPSADLHYPFFIASHELTQHYSRALEIVTNIKHEPLLLWAKFKYYAALAILSHESGALNMSTRQYIDNAIAAYEQQTSGLPYHQKVGVVLFGEYSKIIKRLRLMIKNIVMHSTNN